jgi:hypothetical protein
MVRLGKPDLLDFKVIRLKPLHAAAGIFPAVGIASHVREAERRIGHDRQARRARSQKAKSWARNCGSSPDWAGCFTSG